ncbi:MAG: protein-disulfide reductase DsbD [Gammaproteobacteria bacterium]|nr:protein-disulfide reductase DsbD [Rhodocyclaceae bacterium]MBU3909208.1 protein-disulfide reductase DsbD [Gammaproteobacteria bacterium]MBU3990148.1 protein-disulfide reductase DsbD [Gammaproteobacteria bacterium]MBU4005632.1 protein-disulfide reductase DsbD [Gammaproteobacteria bacterium]MBU4020815.1 protein-disulfide reductase DsbD [Gammaproteobacteria bacterium]
MTLRLFVMLWLALASLTANALFKSGPVDPEQAYRFSARALDAQTIEARWDIQPKYFLYRHKISFAAEPATIKLGEPAIPRGEEKDDEFFGRVEALRGELIVRIPVTAGTGTFVLKAHSQGCWDGGVCYPPITQEATITLATTTGAVPPAPTSSPAAASGTSSAPTGDETSRITALLQGSGFWIAVLSFFGFGLLLSFTPCVFPMIPILSGIIVNHGHAVTTARAFTLSLAYVLGMAATYAAIGVAAGFSGTLLSAALQNVWVLGTFALVFVALAFSMFGFYELQLPGTLQSKLSDTANKQGGSLAAIALMGALSALIVGPCVAAPLAGALLYIAQTRDAILGGAALFAMGMGMGAPLLLVGVFSRSLLPKTGPWMRAVNRFFGVLLLATALWLVSPVLPTWVTMLGWAALLIVPAIYLHAVDPLPPQAGGWQRFWKGIGVAMLLAGAALLVGLLGGSRDPLQPLTFLRGGSAAVSPAPTFEKVKTVTELDARLAAAQKPVLLDFYADWCVSCKEMEKFTFADPNVAAKMREFTLLKADVTANNDADKALLKRFGLFGPPGIIFFDQRGQEIAPLRVVGYMPADAFLATLDKALQ